MSTVITAFVTMSCDGPDCPNTVTFPQTQEGEQEAMASNPWMNSLRFIQTVDQRKFTYCSSVCEIKSAGQGVHEKKVLVAPQGHNSMELAAQAAAKAAEATRALKAGNPVTLS